MWRIDLTDLRRLASPPGFRWNNQLDLVNGSGKPFLLFQAPQVATPDDATTTGMNEATRPPYPIYYRPTAVSLGFSSNGKPSLGIAFGTGDRDDILSTIDPVSLDYPQRFYYVIDDSNATTRSEIDLVRIADPKAGALTTIPTKGWFIQFAKGERLVTDSIAIKGLIVFGTYNPVPEPDTRDPICNNLNKCENQRGLARFYTVEYLPGNPGPGSVNGDRGEDQTYSSFLTNPVFFNENLMFTTDNEVKFKEVKGIRRTNVKDWKENDGPK
jgi:hypothetical protein